MQGSNEVTRSTVDEVSAVSDLLSGKPAKAEPEAAPLHDERNDEDLAFKQDDDTGSPDEPDTDKSGSPDEPDTDKADYRLKLKVSLTKDGEPETLTVGQLKDYYTKARPSELERIERETKQMRDLSELRQIAETLQVLPRERIEQYQQVKQERERRESESLLAIHPEWREPDNFKAARAEIESAIREYELPLDVNPMDSHKWLKYIHDNAVLRRQMKETKAKLQTKNPNDPKGRPRSNLSKAQNLEQMADRAKRSGNLRDQTAAVAALLNN